MRNIYKTMTFLAKPLFLLILKLRAYKGKEDAQRIHERKGIPSLPRPGGSLVWIHAASVGEAQSALILMSAIRENYENVHFLVTTGTTTSAHLMKEKLSDDAFHQFFPLDHPSWVKNFLNHWRPDLILWMESEIWPNMLCEIHERQIPCALVNGRMSDKSFKRWSKLKNMAQMILAAFSELLIQTEKDAQNFKTLGSWDVKVTGNLKFSAEALTADPIALSDLSYVCEDRPLWLYASSHEGEEELAFKAHIKAKAKHPKLLTIIVPRHPERGGRIKRLCKSMKLKATLRGSDKKLPSLEDDIYIADTMGELGLFYRLAPFACIGRSFSNDGGGGHNPIEAAQLQCGVIYGPNVQYQQEIYDEMYGWLAAISVKSEEELISTVERLLEDKEECSRWQQAAQNYASTKTSVLNKVMSALGRCLKQAGLEEIEKTERKEETSENKDDNEQDQKNDGYLY